jgi:hypothetical protein
MWERKCACSVLVGNPEEKRSLGIPRHRLEYNIKMERMVRDVNYIVLCQKDASRVFL